MPSSLSTAPAVDGRPGGSDPTPTTVELCAADYAAAQASRVWQDHRDDANVRR